jgi:hypothetical protein
MATGAIEVSGDVAAAGSALAGLILVYLGAVVASFATFAPAEKRAVAGHHQGRAWFALVGLVLCLASVGLSLFAKWLDIPCMAVTGLSVLVLGLVWVIATAVLAVREIK